MTARYQAAALCLKLADPASLESIKLCRKVRILQAAILNRGVKSRISTTVLHQQSQSFFSSNNFDLKKKSKLRTLNAHRMNQDVSDEGFGDSEPRAQLSSGRWPRSGSSDTHHDAQLQEQRRALNTRIRFAITLVLSYPTMKNV